MSVASEKAAAIARQSMSTAPKVAALRAALNPAKKSVIDLNSAGNGQAGFSYGLGVNGTTANGNLLLDPGKSYYYKSGALSYNAKTGMVEQHTTVKQPSVNDVAARKSNPPLHSYDVVVAQQPLKDAFPGLANTDWKAMGLDPSYAISAALSGYAVSKGASVPNGSGNGFYAPLTSLASDTSWMTDPNGKAPPQVAQTIGSTADLYNRVYTQYVKDNQPSALDNFMTNALPALAIGFGTGQLGSALGGSLGLGAAGSGAISGGLNALLTGGNPITGALTGGAGGFAGSTASGLASSAGLSPSVTKALASGAGALASGVVSGNPNALANAIGAGLGSYAGSTSAGAANSAGLGTTASNAIGKASSALTSGLLSGNPNALANAAIAGASPLISNSFTDALNGITNNFGQSSPTTTTGSTGGSTMFDSNGNYIPDTTGQFDLGGSTQAQIDAQNAQYLQSIGYSPDQANALLQQVNATSVNMSPWNADGTINYNSSYFTNPSSTTGSSSGGVVSSALNSLLSNPNLLSGGLSVVGGLLQGNAATNAASTSAAAQLAAAKMAADAARFKPVGVTTNFGTSNFGYDANGNLTNAGYTLSPQLQAQLDKIMGSTGSLLTQAQGAQSATAPITQGAQRAMALGNSYLQSTPQEQAAKWMADQKALLQQGDQNNYANLQAQLQASGRGGLMTGGGNGFAAANPELNAYYNSLQQRNLGLAANATQAGQQYATYGAGLLDAGGGLMNTAYGVQNNAYTPYSTALGQAQNLEGLGQNAFTLGANIGSSASQAGANAGHSLLLGGTNAANTMQPANAYSPTATALGNLAKLFSPNASTALG